MFKTKREKEEKAPFNINEKAEEKKHKLALSHYLEKIHLANDYQNKDVAEILELDKATYSRIRSQQIAPLTNSIITLKKFAYLNDLSIIEFISKIEGIPAEIKENDWLSTLNNIMLDLGGIMRTELIHSRLSQLIKNDSEHLEKLRKCFVLLTLLIDIVKQDKYDKWFNICSDMIIKIHDNLGILKTKNIEALIARISIKKRANSNE